MSGRSAHVRKKIHEPNKGKAAERRRSSASADRDDLAVIGDFPMPSGPLGTGVGTTNARFLKFSDNMSPPPGVMESSGYAPGSSTWNRNPSVRSGASSGSNGDPRFDGYGAGGMDEYGFTRQRRPTIKTEDVSGIERSGLRSMLDKKSDGVRKGLAKTFAFRKKDKDAPSPEPRPASAATVRPDLYAQGRQHQTYDHYGNHPPMPLQMPMQRQTHSPHQYPVQQGQLPQHRWPGTMPDSWESNSVGPPPTGKLPPIPQNQGPAIKRWIGAGRPVQRWNKLRKDPELWDPNGDVLVFLAIKGQTPRPPPSFRLSSHIIEATESRYLVTQLREGFNEDDPYSPIALSPVGGHSHPHLLPPMGRGGQPTPPVSEDASIGDTDGQISYEMYFPAPANLNRTDQLRHQITTRNVFALLYHASLVGLSLHQALSDLHTRLDAYMPPESDNVGQIINYLSARGIDDIRSDPETAVSLLAWSEGQDVRWEEGWRECFIHCTGMYRDLERCSDYKMTAPITKALLERACLEMQLRVQSAEERLAEFAYDDMWPASMPVAKSAARAAAGRLQQMFVSHYASIYGSWPPATFSGQRSPPGSPVEEDDLSEEDMWLTRTIASHLQKDFGALYDYLVNRDIVWDVSEARSGRKWLMASESGNRAFEADVAEVPITDILIEFDNKLRFPHIPHPYPLVPESIPATANLPTSSSKSNLFKSSSNTSGKGSEGRSGPSGGSGKAGSMERRVHLAYTESTNIYALGSDFTHSELIDAFVAFEKTDRVGEVDPATARRGRWVLIYGVLQTLASVSVDTPRVRYHEGVRYHLSPRLKGSKIPPWKGAVTSMGAEEAGHERSHCWRVPETWGSPGSSGDDEEQDRYSDGSIVSEGRVDSDVLSRFSRSGSAAITTASSVASSGRGMGGSESSVAAGKRVASAHAYRPFPSVKASNIRSGSRSRSTASFLHDETASAAGDGGSARSESARWREKPLLERDEDEYEGATRSRGQSIRDFDEESYLA
ncbi:hypothetical protein NLU13_9813 [Sarocladium strictum]|uniref:DUF8004 domain-containing protein n=1 Tax=Sarocladium strictum TaxID=5046 RepID=A0AA39G8N9_SARSR|nr:hypothetical protein NLU13_9813 [Sarocladium strictum]